MTRMADRRVLITGAAHGLGRAIAVAFADEGADVALIDSDGEGLEATAESLEWSGRTLVARRCDVSNEEDVREAINAVMGELGGIDVLVNNAAVNGRGEKLLDLSLSEWDRVNAINLRGAFVVAQQVARMMASAEGGCIINMASNVSSVVVAYNNHYAVSKGGIAQLTRGLAVELASHGIRVNAIAPGVIETQMTERARHDDRISAQRLQRIPLGRFGHPQEVAGAALFLASDDATYITGAILPVDGGYTAT